MRSYWSKLLAALFSLSQMACSRADAWHEHVLPNAGSPFGKHYMVYLPKDYASNAAQVWPVIVALHGRGE